MHTILEKQIEKVILLLEQRLRNDLDSPVLIILYKGTKEILDNDGDTKK